MVALVRPGVDVRVQASPVHPEEPTVAARAHAPRRRSGPTIVREPGCGPPMSMLTGPCISAFHAPPSLRSASARAFVPRRTATTPNWSVRRSETSGFPVQARERPQGLLDRGSGTARERGVRRSEALLRGGREVRPQRRAVALRRGGDQSRAWVCAGIGSTRRVEARALPAAASAGGGDQRAGAATRASAAHPGRLALPGLVQLRIDRARRLLRECRGRPRAPPARRRGSARPSRSAGSARAGARARRRERRRRSTRAPARSRRTRW